MEPRIVYMSKFNTGTTIRGIPMNTILVAVLIAAPLMLIGQAFLPVIPLLILSGLLIWRVFIPLAEWLTEVIPPRYFQHLLEWLVQGGTMYVTNDSSPIPLAMERTRDIQTARQEQVRHTKKMAT